MSTHSLQKELNQKQQEALSVITGPALILAGAGSGKTKTLTHRIAWLILAKNIPASQILAVTFTNKAAGEMKERIQKLFKGHAPSHLSAMPLVGTFHHICAFLLRKEIQVLGYSQHFTIINDHDQLSLVKKIQKSLEINPDQFQPRALLSAISKAKSALLSPEELVVQAESYYEEIVAKAYATYQKTLKEMDSLDFDDLIYLTVQLFSSFPQILEKYQDRFQFLLVDEYQDTNHSQYTFIKLLSQKHRNLFVIGDDYQSIYGWRQADIRNILNFENDYPEAKVITLEQNYRSTQNILDAASSVIKNNSAQRHKKLWTEGKAGQPLIRKILQTEREEASYVCQEIKNLQKEGSLYRDCAILYRTNSQSRVFEELLITQNIPYIIVGGIRFYERKEIRDILAYLKILYSPKDMLSLERILNEPRRGIGEITRNRWFEIARKKLFSPIHLSKDDFIGSPLKASKIEHILAFNKTLQSLERSLREQSCSLTTFVRGILDQTGYIAALKSDPENQDRLENIQEFFTVTQKFDDLPLNEAIFYFLDEVALTSDIDSSTTQKDAVQLMTLHSSKGLEFPVVFLAGLEEGVFPHSRSQFSNQELEEERRLMYVGITRARQKIYFLSVEWRTLFGSTQINPPSRFIDEIPKELFSPTERKFSQSKKTTTPLKEGVNKPSLVEILRPGDSVSHPDFGQGIIISIQGTVASVAFKRKGLKKLALGIAPLIKLF